MVSKRPNYAEVKYFKILLQNFSVLIEFGTFKLYISLGSILKITKRNRKFAVHVNFMQYVHFCVQHQLEMFQKCTVFVKERMDILLLCLHLKFCGNIIHIEIRNEFVC